VEVAMVEEEVEESEPQAVVGHMECLFDPDAFEEYQQEIEDRLGQCLNLDEADGYVQDLIEQHRKSS